MIDLLVAIVAAAGTVISAWLVVRVRKVQETVNGHTARLEDRIDELERQLVRSKIVPIKRSRG